MNKKFMKYRIVVSIIAIISLVINLITQLDSTLLNSVTVILPALIVFPFAYESYQDKKWLSFTAYSLIIVLSTLGTIQYIYRFYILYH